VLDPADRGDGGERVRLGAAVPVEVSVGDVLVFSSLTIHRSGPNLTGSTRKAYIVHYCADGTRWVDSMEHRGYKSLVCDDPRRQYVVARGGVPVES
jgi:ectoine hydroxylase-related dioxygenase (phytanoyl-CoA dioxygenase family)